MEIYKKIVIDEIKKADTDVKKLILKKRNYSSPNFMILFDDMLFKCGLISTNVIPAQKNKYIAYLNFQDGNIFREERGVINLHKTPETYKTAQVILANKVISLLGEVNFDKVKEKISKIF